MLPLDAAERRKNGSPAIVQDVNEFQKNFALFSESSLVDLDWSNVVAAGYIALLTLPDSMLELTQIVLLSSLVFCPCHPNITRVRRH